MKKSIISIDEKLCNGCGACIEKCHDGALQIIEGKVQIVSGFCFDDSGVYINSCPIGAIITKHCETNSYDEFSVIEQILNKGEKTILAHLKYLEEHNKTEYLNQAIEYLKQHNIEISTLSAQNPTVGRRCPGCPGWNGICIC